MEKLQVIIGRFQTNRLHEGHKELIRAAKATGNDVLILIGCTDAVGTDKNPLDFETRKHLFNTYFNNISSRISMLVKWKKISTDGIV